MLCFLFRPVITFYRYFALLSILRLQSPCFPICVCVPVSVCTGMCVWVCVKQNHVTTWWDMDTIVVSCIRGKIQRPEQGFPTVLTTRQRALGEGAKDTLQILAPANSTCSHSHLVRDKGPRIMATAKVLDVVTSLRVSLSR